MDYETLKSEIYKLNEDEVFYRKYYYARQQEYSLNKFLTELDMSKVYEKHYLIPEIPNTIPPRFEDSFYLDADKRASLITLRHNRYSPAIIHDHTFFELIYVYEGVCEQVISNNKKNLSMGDVCIIPPGIKHSIGVFDDSIVFNCLIRKSTLHNIFFNFLNNPNILSAFFINNIYSENGNDYIIFHTGNDYEIHRGVIYMYKESLEKTLYWDQMISYMLMLIFGTLIRNYEKSIELPTFMQKTDVQRFALLQYVQDNFSTITLNQVAEKFHYTPEYTSRLFKSTTGRSFTQILQQVRLERAQVLLQDTNLSVANIANQIGYETTEHFIRIFKKQMHMTPTEYRRKGIVI
ncbi:MAG: AraC family transcriptional regulator [Lachnospiraceae bacterium]|nr:AraC family transcriptional regulator [Lachnospiraceae bacterium]MBD5489349.1 AraC family transcriptional regulator [Lachnospiraceae bacterium]